MKPASPGPAPAELRFGAALLQVAQRRLLIDGQSARLGARAFDVLVALVERRDRAVGKNELLELVWPGTIVEENNLQVHISTLRKLLGPQAIATIPGRGYRFTALVNSPDDAETAVAAAPIVAPADVVAGAAQTSLPATQPTLYGRGADAAAICALIDRHPLVSIIGAAGIGKTRLASMVAGSQRERFRDGVWWVELAALVDGDQVAGAIAQALGMSGDDGRPSLDGVVALLRKQAALLVLDNCEHLLDAATDCIRVLLAGAPALRILVTSQEALHTPEEQVYRLGPLQVESAAGDRSPAVDLFIARAMAADPHLRITSTGLLNVAEICRRLDGLPLAIELAAARVRLLGIDGLRARLDERFRILTGGTRTVLRRHQTLRAALDWSHALLSSEERVVFRRLGVFVGGFSLELAQDVATDERIDRWAVLDLIGHLVDKSLVVADGGDLPRYRLLETMRAFALEQLAAAGETPALLRRHAEALLAFVTPLDQLRWKASTADQVRCGAELDNVRAALDWAGSASGDRMLACTLIAHSSSLWLVRARLNEGVERALALLPLPAGVSTEVEARFHLFLADLGYIGPRRECFRAALRAAELYRSLRNTPRRIDALIAAAQIGARLGEAEQVGAAVAEAESLIGPDAPPRQAAALEVANAMKHVSLDQYEQAVEHALRQAEIYRNSGNPFGVQLAMSNAAFYECGLGRYDSAIVQLRSVLGMLREMNAPYGIGTALAFLASAHALRGDRDEAMANGRAAVPYLQRIHDIAPSLLTTALVHARHRAEDRAADLLGYVDHAFARTGRIPFPIMRRMRDEILAHAAAALGPDGLANRMAAGATLTEEQALARAYDDGADPGPDPAASTQDRAGSDPRVDPARS